MRKIVFIFFFCFQCFQLTAVFADSRTLYSFTTPKQNQRFYDLSQQLRCLVCQNESLLDSTAPLAKDLRQQLANMVLAGKTDKQIKTYFVSRYGNFVLYQPPMDATNLILWFSPFVLLFLGLTGFFTFVHKHKKMNEDDLDS